MERSILKAGYRLIQFLSKHQGKFSNLLILTHDYPDPDALASAYGLHYLLKEGYGVSSKIVYGGIIGRTENRAMVRLLKIPVQKLRKSDWKRFSQVALVDTQPDFKNNSFPKRRKAFLVIDQHSSVTKPNAQFSIIDTECAATCVILAQALLFLKLEIPTSLATALAYGILSDTMHLYRVKRQDVVQTYLNILPKANVKTLAKIQNPSRPDPFFITMRRALDQAVVNRGLILSHLGRVGSPDFVSQIADFLLTSRGKRWSFVTGRYHNRLHVSLRMGGSSQQADQVLRDIFLDRGEAGGHGSIAGGSIRVTQPDQESSWKKAEHQLTERLVKRLPIAKQGNFRHPFRGTD